MEKDLKKINFITSFYSCYKGYCSFYNYIHMPKLFATTEERQKVVKRKKGKIVNPINTGGGGVFPTPCPVNGSELHNGTSWHLETW